jgi:hypothetical protein
MNPLNLIPDRIWHRERNKNDAYLEDINPVIAKVNDIIAVINVANTYQGVIDCSTNPNYPAATEGQYWRVSVAGKIGGGSGVAVEAGDEILCIATNAGGTEAQVGASFMLIQKNMIPCTVAVAQTGSNNTDFVTALTLAGVLNGGSAFATTTDTLILSGGTNSQLYIHGAAAADGINFGTGLTTGSLIEYLNIDSKVSGYLFNGSMTNSILTDSTIIDDFTQGCDHDGVGSDTLIGKRFVWSGNVPNGTLVSDLTIYDIQFSGIYGSGGNTAGVLTGQSIQLAGTMNDLGAKLFGLDITLTTVLTKVNDVAGVNVDLSGLTLTSTNDVYGIKVKTKVGVDAAIYAVDTQCIVYIADNISAIAIGGTATNGISFYATAGLTNVLDFDAIAGPVIANALVPAVAPDASTMGADACLKIDIGGTPYYIPLYDTLHA